MTEDSCPCCGTDTERGPATDASTEQWQIGDSLLTTELPDELGSALGRFLGTEPVDTLGGWVAAVRYHVDGSTVSLSELETNVTDGGVSKDGIPSIDDPALVRSAEAGQ